jgi:hypothetical protein
VALTATGSTNELREYILDVLPEFEHFPRRCEPDAYGASYLIAQELGLDKVPESTSTWTHGWPYVPLVYPDQVAQQSNARQTNLVPTEDIAQFLREEFSYRNVHAVGSPFIYADPLDMERIPNSLLVMPPHTLPYLEDEWDEAAYVSAIREVADGFDHVIACIHRHDIKKGNWVDTFSEARIPHVPGTRVRDKHGLVRMQTLFHLFDAVTANTIGSHVAYAAYCGCRVSIYGPYAHRSLSDFKEDPIWSGDREPVLRHNLKHTREEAIRNRYPFLFAPPSKSESHVEWAEKELGEECKRTPNELYKLLGWGMLEQARLKMNHYKSRGKVKIGRMVDRAAAMLGVLNSD